MNNFTFSYDEDHDDLFMYLEGKKSAGAVEIGSFVFDFDEEKNLVALQILNATEVLSKLIRKIISLANVKAMRAEVINFRNMEAINLEISLTSGIERFPIIIPRIEQESPSLRY